jgi:hypothetical protein
MPRLARVAVAAVLAAAAFAPSLATAAPPCQVTLERRWVGGPTWTAMVLVPTVTCS